MAGEHYDYTKSLLPAGNGSIHAMSGGGYGQPQEGGAYLSQKKLDELFSFVYDEKDSKGYLTNNKTNDSKLIGIISNLLFRKLTASEPLFSTVKDNKTKSYFYYKIVKSDSGADNFIVTPYVTSGTKPDVLKPISGATQTGSGNISKDDKDKLLNRLFNILMNRDDADSAKQVNEIRLLFSFKESSLPDKYVPILEDIKGAAKKAVRKITDDEYNKIAAEFPMQFGGGGAPPADFEAQAQALIDGIPKLGDKVTAIKPRADKYKVDNPGSDAEIDALVKALDDSLSAYSGIVAKILDKKANIAAAAGDPAKKIVVDDIQKIIDDDLKKQGNAVQKALEAVETKISSASSVADYGAQAQTIYDQIGLLAATVRTALDTLKADNAKLPTDGSQKVLIDKLAVEIPALDTRFTKNTNKSENDTLLQGANDVSEPEDDRKGYVSDLQNRLDDLTKAQTEIGALQVELATALGTPAGSTSTITPVKAEETITVLNMPYKLMLPVEAADFDSLDKPGFEALKKLHHDFGLDYIKDDAKQKANEKKAEFVNNLNKCQTVMTSLKDEDCDKFRGIVTEVIQNIVGMDISPGGAATTSSSPPPPPNFVPEATTLQTEILALYKQIISSNITLHANINKITDKTKQDSYNVEITRIESNINTKYTDSDTIKKNTDKHIADAADPTKGQAEVDALKAIKTDLESINKEVIDLTSRVNADLGAGGPPPVDFVAEATELQTKINTLAQNISTLITSELIPNIQKITDITKRDAHQKKLDTISKTLNTKYPAPGGANPMKAITDKHVADAADPTKGQTAVDSLKAIKTELEGINKELNDLKAMVDTDLSAGGAGRDFAAEHASLDAEIQTLITSIEKLNTDTDTSISKIADAKTQSELDAELSIFDGKWTNFLTPAAGDGIKENRDKYKTDALGGVKADAEAAIKALTALRDQLKGFDAEIKAIAAKIPKAVHVGGGVKKGIVNFSGSACYFNGIIQMLNQIPEFVQAITAFEPSKFEPTKDAEKELGFFDDDYIKKEEEIIAKDQALIDKIINDNKNPSTLIFDIDDRKKIVTLKNELKTIREQLAKKYKTDIKDKSKDEIKTITEKYIKIKNDPNSQPPENKEIADIYISLDAKKNEVDTSEKEASTKYPQKWRDSSTGKISEATINVLRENLSKKITALTKLKAFKTSGGKIDFSKFITPLEALKNIFVALNKDDGNKTVDIRDFNKTLLNYKPEKFFVNEAGGLKQEDAKELLNSLLFDLLQKDKTLNNIFSKLVFKYKDRYICDTDPNQEIRTIKFMLENSSEESDYQISSIALIALPVLDDGTIDKAPISIQERINKAMVPEKNIELLGCNEFPLNIGEKQELIEIPDENKYILINFTREFFDPVTGKDGISNKEIEIEYEITIDSKKYIAIGSVIYSGRGSSGHYMFQSFKQSGDKAIPYWEFDDGTSVFEITGSHPTAYNVKAQGLLFLYKRKDVMTGGKRRLGQRGRTLRTSRIAPEQSGWQHSTEHPGTGKRTLKARVAATTFLASTPGPAQTKRRHLKARTTLSRTERSRVSGRLPIRRAAGK